MLRPVEVPSIEGASRPFVGRRWHVQTACVTGPLIGAASGRLGPEEAGRCVRRIWCRAIDAN